MLIPKDLDEALTILINDKQAWTVKELKKYDSKEDFLAQQHLMGGGLWLRNEWKLWDNNAEGISSWFATKGIRHGDDKSSIILMALWSFVTADNTFDLDYQIAWYRGYWQKVGINPDTI